jgi:hypothetical protein
MKRLLISVAASLMLMLALVAPVGATDPGPGCSDFGAATAGLTKAWHPFGQVVSGVAHDGITANGKFYAGVSQLVQGEHRGDLGYPCAKFRP